MLYLLTLYFYMFSKLHNIYWYIRTTKDKTKKRYYYRKAAKEKKRLLDAGVNQECLRLLCRCLSFRQNNHAERRYQGYKSKCQFCR